ncbi:MAG: integrase domain-containing protein [Betaproteobacteria bacterium]|nr:integrase domain-containing protein [Betaproteobacteria bacterium]
MVKGGVAMQILDYRREIERYGFPARLERELAGLFQKLNGQPGKRRRTDALVSHKTRYRRFVNVCATLRDLAQVGYQIESIYNLKEKHVAALVVRWESEGQTVGTIENKLSYLRTLCKWVGKPGMIGAGATYSAKSGSFKRPGAAQVDKSWEGNGIDPVELLERVARHDEVVSLQLELQWAFGIRMEEACLLRPVTALRQALGTGKVLIEHGTKGGRPRSVTVDQVWPLEVLTRAAQPAVSRTGTMIPREYTLDRWKDHYYYVVRRKCGLTKKDLGSTGHGARHSYLQRKFEAITGKPAPVKGGSNYDPELLEWAMREVVERAGHSRPAKGQAYLGQILVRGRGAGRSRAVLRW